jgi:hypothetical protein
MIDNSTELDAAPPMLLNRRDFLKVATGTVGLLLTNSSIDKEFFGNYLDQSVQRASERLFDTFPKVLEIYGQAVASGDPEMVLESEKVFWCWLGANYVPIFSEKSGINLEDMLMERYLSRTGEPYDASKQIENKLTERYDLGKLIFEKYLDNPKFQADNIDGIIGSLLAGSLAQRRNLLLVINSPTIYRSLEDYYFVNGHLKPEEIKKEVVAVLSQETELKGPVPAYFAPGLGVATFRTRIDPSSFHESMVTLEDEEVNSKFEKGRVIVVSIDSSAFGSLELFDLFDFGGSHATPSTPMVPLSAITLELAQRLFGGDGSWCNNPPVKGVEGLVASLAKMVGKATESRLDELGIFDGKGNLLYDNFGLLEKYGLAVAVPVIGHWDIQKLKMSHTEPTARKIKFLLPVMSEAA